MAANAIALIGSIFLLVGCGAIAGSVVFYQNTQGFLAEAIATEGTVVDLARSRSDGSIVYRPEVRFVSEDGQEVAFVSPVGSNPPSYAPGDSVGVLYPAENPQNARIQAFFPLWGGAVIFGSLGATFTAIGGGLLVAGRTKTRRDAFLQCEGMPVRADFLGVERNTFYRVNGRHPFRVLVQWQNPATSEIHVFKSNNIWYDPSDYINTDKINTDKINTDKINTDKITVFIDPKNPQKYYVDLSFLPKLAK